ncbi:MAG: metalloregulator ArsR/SmtB family transcription factor [Hyphomicrobiales bacterium]|nr:metalloregulator ArsR/SmtB family transcription factor [Hyphomicrobiales bacterium]
MAVKSASAKRLSSQNAEPDAILAQERIALLAKALGHPARIQVIETLLRRKICIGCDIVDEIGLAPSTTSEHLRILKNAGLIVGEIDRPRVCYSIDPSAVQALIDFLLRIQATIPPSIPEAK